MIRHSLQYSLFFTFCALFLMTSITVTAQNDGFSASTIPDAVFNKMQGKSFPKGCKTKRSDLRYITLLFVDEKGNTQHGELICNKQIASDIIAIFRELYKQKYPIHSVRLVDEYDGNDEKSMEANNTSSFNYRLTSNGTLSKHARGMAIDVNPLWNPCIHISDRNAGKIEPSNAKRQHVIDKNDLCYKLFTKHGFKWGGAWRSLKDYQHFEK